MNMMSPFPRSAPFGGEEVATLTRMLQGSTPEQRAWLTGFIAGFDFAQGQDVGTAVYDAPEAAGNVTVVYATESGNSESIAYQAKKLAGRMGYSAAVHDMADLAPEAIAEAERLLIIASTWGEGEPPARAAAFYRALMSDGAPRFEGVRYAVLALGDSAYANFCETGKAIDRRLEELGGRRIAPRVDCDLDFEAPAEAWLERVLARESPAQPRAAAPVSLGEPLSHTKSRPFEAEITELVNLNGSRSGKQTFHVELSLRGSGIAFEPGDAIGIVPRNDPAEVEAVCAAAGIVPDEHLRRELSERFEITTLTPPVVQKYAALGGTAALRDLAADGRVQEYVQGRHVVDLLSEFPQTLTAEQLTGMLRPLPPRLYSVASSLKAAPGEAHLLVGLVSYESHGRARKGVTSGFVGNRRNVGDTLPVYVKPNRHFRLPADGDTPIIMVGPGTGVAPFRAFLQEREATGARGASWLFFGERNYTHDFLYQLDWQDLMKSGALGRIDVAFSRDQPEKVYVQHKLWQQRDEVYGWLRDGAHLFVCGDANHMAKDVHATLARIAMDRGGLDADAAEAWLADLAAQGRYNRDVY